MDAAQDIKVQIISNTKYNPSQTSTIELTEEEQIFEYKAKEETTVFVVIPPDGGWGWIVVTAAFFSFLIADGMIYTFGIFILDMSETLNCSKSDIVLVGGITTGFFCITGPFTSALINRFGYRKIAIMGSVLAAVACLLTANAATLGIVYLTLGVLGGIGFGMIYLPAVIAVGFYFERLRALATGIAVCGSGMGGIILPVILTTILNESGWRYTYKIMSILCGSCAFSGYLFKPLKPTKVQIELEDDGVSTITQETSKSVFNKLHNNAHPTIYEVHSKSYSVIVDMPTYVLKTSDLKIKRKKISPDDASRSGTTDNTSTVTIFQPFRKLDQNNSSEFVVGRMSYCTTSGSSYKNFKMTKPENSIQSAMASTTLTQNQLATVDEETKTTWICSKLIYELQACFCTVCVRLKKCFTKNRENTADAITRPIYRDDIFYSGSLLILPEYQKYTSQSKCATSSAAASKSGVEYSMAITRTITQRELVEEKSNKLCSEAIKRTLATMLDFSLLKSPSFLLLVINSIFTSLGYYTPYLFIRDRCIERGISNNIAFWLISCIGITSTIGRIICGVLTSVYGVSAINVTYGCLFVGGLATALSGLSFNAWAQFLYAALYGFCIACTSALRTIIIVDLLGLEKLTNAIGILLMFQGFATLIGTATSGILREMTGNYQLSFHFAGGCLALGSLILIPIKKVSEWEKIRKEAN